MSVVVRTDTAPIRERSANNTKPDIIVVLDNSLFPLVDVTKGLKKGGTVMALGVDGNVLGEKAGQFLFVAMDTFVKSRDSSGIEAGVVSSLEDQKAV